MTASAKASDSEKRALLSKDGLYRWWLSRRWAPGPYVLFIGFNPSTADAEKDDPTIRREVQFAKDWGFSAMAKVNLFAWRSTDPAALRSKDVRDPIGRWNEHWISFLGLKTDTVVAAWGGLVAPHWLTQANGVRAMFGRHGLYCLGRTKDGHPRHPLYLPKAQGLETYD